MISVLFVCVHNAARSQMAEAYLNDLGKGLFFAESAGLEKGTLNPIVVEVMKEDGYDISGNQTKSAFDFLKQGKRYTYVITVCDEANGQRCPIFPNTLKTFHWNVSDPAAIEGSFNDKINGTRKIQTIIKEHVNQFIQEYSEYARARKE